MVQRSGIPAGDVAQCRGYRHCDCHVRSMEAYPEGCHACGFHGSPCHLTTSLSPVYRGRSSLAAYALLVSRASGNETSWLARLTSPAQRWVISLSIKPRMAVLLPSSFTRMKRRKLPRYSPRNVTVEHRSKLSFPVHTENNHSRLSREPVGHTL